MIYKNDEKEEKASHITYKEYKQKFEKKPNEGLILFVSAFFVMLLIFLGIVKQLSPDVDVTIGDNSDNVAVEEFEKSNIDSRLKAIQMEDNSFMEDETFSPELDEKVLLPKHKKTLVEETLEEEVIVLNNNKEVQETVAAAPVPTVNAKVIVGYYATAELANAAKGIIIDAGLDIQPFVKNIGGAYTLQVGSFSSREKAQSVANELLKNNFPARVIVE